VRGADFASTHFLARPVGPQPKIKMPDIGDIMDVNIEDLSPEQRQQLQDAADQFQQKCLLSFKKNRSGVLLPVKIRQPSHEFTFGVGMSFIPYPLVLTPVV
jgi:hypothetical protein